MLKFASLFAALLFFTNCSHKLSSYHLKDYKSIERVRIGMPLDAAIKIANKNYFVEKSRRITSANDDDDYEYTAYSDKTKKEPLFTFDQGYDKQTSDNVFRLIIKSPKYYTQEGICVGMSMKDLKEKAQLKSANFNYDDGLYIISDKFDGGYWMDIKKYSTYNFEEPQINALPEEMKIKAIIIF